MLTTEKGDGLQSGRRCKYKIDSIWSTLGTNLTLNASPISFSPDPLHVSKSETETGKPGSEKQKINIKRVDQVEICLLEDDKTDWL